jgi:hypothetical protein
MARQHQHQDGGKRVFRIGWPIFIAIGTFIVVAAAFPLLAAFAAGTIANLNGCALNEGSANPCVIAGTDYGETLYSLGVVGWLAIATVPIGIAALAVWALVFIVTTIRAAAHDRRVRDNA